MLAFAATVAVAVPAATVAIPAAAIATPAAAVLVGGHSLRSPFAVADSPISPVANDATVRLTLSKTLVVFATLCISQTLSSLGPGEVGWAKFSYPIASCAWS